mgnify:CR=1 FL=1
MRAQLMEPVTIISLRPGEEIAFRDWHLHAIYAACVSPGIERAPWRSDSTPYAQLAEDLAGIVYRPAVTSADREWLATYAMLRSALRDLYDTEDEITTWLHSRQRLLGDRTPAELVDADRADEVWALIDQLRTGAFV